MKSDTINEMIQGLNQFRVSRAERLYSHHQLYRLAESDVVRLPWEITLWLEYGLCEWNTEGIFRGRCP
jgi:hypothetical protein